MPVEMEVEVSKVKKKPSISSSLLAKAYKDPLVMAERLFQLQKAKDGSLLEPVILKGKGSHGTYWAHSDKRFVKVARKSCHYLVPWRDPEDEKARFIYTHHIAHAGVIIRVEKDDYYHIGFN
jgi:hypothetical protein